MIAQLHRQAEDAPQLKLPRSGLVHRAFSDRSQARPRPHIQLNVSEFESCRPHPEQLAIRAAEPLPLRLARTQMRPPTAAMGRVITVRKTRITKSSGNPMLRNENPC